MDTFDPHEFDPSTRYLRVAVPPDLAKTYEVRRLAERLASAASLSPSRTYDLKLVLSEAVANAIEHATVPGDVEVVAWLLPDRLVVEVTNLGNFEPGLSKDTVERRRGLGLALMVSLADQMHISRLPDAKTRVSLTFFRERNEDPGAHRTSGDDGDGIALPGSPTTTLVQLEAERLKVHAALAEADRHAAAARMRDVRFHAVADFTHDWELWLSPDGSIIYSSPSCERITGYTADELTTDPRLLGAMVHPDDRERVRKRYRARHAESTGPFECRIITKDRDVRWIGMSSQPIADGDGTYLGLRISGRDITSHMQIVEALRESEERLRMALSNARIIIYAVDREQRYLWAENPDPIFDSRSIVGKTTSELLPSLDAPRVVEARRRVIETGVGLRSDFSLPVGGRPRTFEYNIEPLRNTAGEVTGALVAAVDISERRQAEEELYELSQRLSFHVDHSPLAVIEWGPDMRIVRWSGEAERMFGWRADEVLGKRMEDFHWIYDEDHERVADVSSDLQAGTNPRRSSMNRNYRNDGSVIWCEWYNSSLMDESGRLRSILSLVLDVTERTEAEQHLRRHGEILRTVTEAIITTDERFVITSWNRAAERLYGWSEEEVLGRTIEKVLRTERTDDDRERALSGLLHDRSWSGEVVERRRDGSPIWIQSAVTVLTDPAGKPVGTVAVNRDITARRREHEQRE